MKRTFILFLLLGWTILGTKAQIAKWLIKPEHLAIYFDYGTDIIITQSADGKTLWNLNGEKLASTSNELWSFKEGRAVVTLSGKTNIDCLFKEDGTPIPVCGYHYACKFPYFSCGKLLVMDQESNSYKYMNLDGTIGSGSYLQDTYPFFNGYARCEFYADPEKKKDPRYALINEQEELILFVDEKGKGVKIENVDFVSSVNDENIAIVVIKNKVYTFDGKTQNLSPFYEPKTEMIPKNQAKIDGNLICIAKGNGWKISAVSLNQKNKVAVEFELDSLLRPVSYTANEVTHRYASSTTTAPDRSSRFTVKKGNDSKLGICDENGNEMLPQQFDAISTCFGNKAFVMFGGKYGMVEVQANKHFDLKLNGGKDVSFIHKEFETTLSVELPPSIPVEDIFLDVASQTGITKKKRREETTREGNLVEYDCILILPDSLTDEPMEVTYPVQVTYDSLKLPWQELKVKEKFYKKFDINIKENSINDGTLTLDFEITNNMVDNSRISPTVSVSAYTLFTDTLQADTLTTQQVQKFSETHYRYVIFNLHEGTNTVEIDIAEDGCPTSSFSYDFEYHKAIKKTSSTEEEKERVEQKSSKIVIKPRPTKKQKTSDNQRNNNKVDVIGPGLDKL